MKSRVTTIALSGCLALSVALLSLTFVASNLIAQQAVKPLSDTDVRHMLEIRERVKNAQLMKVALQSAFVKADTDEVNATAEYATKLEELRKKYTCDIDDEKFVCKPGSPNSDKAGK